jgi:glycosyltransferase involved in cell wall biosynthesis
MRIAQIAPLWESVPPKTYGGTELVVHLLTEELVRRGHEVTLFASGDSQTAARLHACSRSSLRQMQDELHLDKNPLPVVAFETRLLEQVFSRADEFEIIHNHMGMEALPMACFTQTPVLSTLHGVFEPPPMREFIQHYRDLPYVSISNFQRRPCPMLNYVATIYHGIPLEHFNPSLTFHDKDYLAFLGRFSLEKGPHHAIRIAKETGWKLVLAGKIDPIDKSDQEYFTREIEPHLDGKQIRYIGEVDHKQKVELLRNAAATLCPVTWPEPFGLVLIESMACGTPVFALRNGSIPEVIAHGQAGYVADSVDELVQALANLGQYDRRNCRYYVESRFSVSRMVDDYLKVYKMLAIDKIVASPHQQTILDLSDIKSF